MLVLPEAVWVREVLHSKHRQDFFILRAGSGEVPLKQLVPYKPLDEESVLAQFSLNESF